MKNIKKRYAFTLVELIVVITILAILGTISFIAFQGYSRAARDSKRISDIQNIKKALEVYQVQSSRYPEPSYSTGITYSGSTIRTQGTIGDSVISNVSKTLNFKPLDPLTDNEYTYSVLNTGLEYQLGLIREDNELFSNNILSTTYASDQIAYVDGNYNGQVATVKVGAVEYILAVPSIINSDIEVTDYIEIVEQKTIVYDGYTNVPYSYLIDTDLDSGSFEYTPGNVVVYSGSLEDLEVNEVLRIHFLEALQDAYSGTIIVNDDSGIEEIVDEEIDTDNPTTQARQLAIDILVARVNLEIGEEQYPEPNPCVLDGVIINHGETITAYQNEEILWDATETCGGTSQLRTCTQGNLSGDDIYSYLTCFKGEPDNCETREQDGYIIPYLEHAGTGSIEKILSVTDGDITYTATALCNNGTIEIYGETEELTCDSTYHIEFDSEEDTNACVSNTRDCYTIPNGIGEEYWDLIIQDDWSECILVSCDTDFHEDSENENTCISNTQEVECGGVQDINSTATNGTTYEQTWNGTMRTPTILWGESQTYCDFDCSEHYTWNETTEECEANNYTVSFDSNGGTTSVPTSKIVTYDTAVGTLATTTREGYTFEGWFTASSGGTELTTATIVTGDVTYYAQWTLINYLVTFDSNGGTTSDPTSKFVSYNTAVGDLAITSREGYTFNGWYTASSGGTEVTTATLVTGAVTYYAQWIEDGVCGTAESLLTTTAPTTNLCTVGTASTVVSNAGTFTWTCEVSGALTDSCSSLRQYTVSFDSNGGTTSVPTSKIVTYNTAIGDLSTTSREGYIFEGWFTASSGGTELTTSTIVTGDVTYYAQWTLINYLVTFDSNGGTTSDPTSKFVSYNTAVGDLAITSREGYTFNGWYTASSGGTEVTTATLVTGAVTYYAQWIEDGVCGTAESLLTTIAPTTNLCTVGTASTVVSNAGTFTWTCEVSGALTDSCSSLRQYTVSFDSNGGITSVPTSKIVTYNTAIGDLATTSREGYTFEGWFTASSGGTELTTSTIVTGDVTYYAQWTANTQIVSCGGSIPSYATATTSSTYEQTWDGSGWTPTIVWGESQTECDFNCNTNYTYNSTTGECDPNCRSCSVTKCYRDIRWYNDSDCTDLIKTIYDRGPANSTHSDGSFFCYENNYSPYWNGGPCRRETTNYVNNCDKCGSY